MFETLVSYIEQRIKQNGNKEITGVIHQTVLKEMISKLGLLQFKGFATSETVPESGYDGTAFYVAKQGYYSHFGSGVWVTAPLGIIKFDGSTWSVENVTLSSLFGNGSTTKINESDTPESLMNGYGTGSVFPTFRMDYMSISTDNYLVLSLLSENSKLGFQLAFKIGANLIIMRNAVDNVWASWGSLFNSPDAKIESNAISGTVIVNIPANCRITNITFYKKTLTPTVKAWYTFESAERSLCDETLVGTLPLSVPCSEPFENVTELSISSIGGTVDTVIEYKSNLKTL